MADNETPASSEDGNFELPEGALEAITKCLDDFIQWFQDMAIRRGLAKEDIRMVRLEITSFLEGNEVSSLCDFCFSAGPFLSPGAHNARFDSVKAVDLIKSCKKQKDKIVISCIIGRNEIGTFTFDDLQQSTASWTKVEHRQNKGSCQRCAAASLWQASRLLSEAVGTESTQPRPDDFGGACDNCNMSFCAAHAPKGTCPMCGSRLTG